MCVLCVHPDHTHQAHKPLVSSIGRNPNHFVVVPATFFYLSTLILSLYTEGTTTYLRRFSCSCIMSVVFSSCDLLQLLCGRPTYTLAQHVPSSMYNVQICVFWCLCVRNVTNTSAFKIDCVATMHTFSLINQAGPIIPRQPASYILGSSHTPVLRI